MPGFYAGENVYYCPPGVSHTETPAGFEYCIEKENGHWFNYDNGTWIDRTKEYIDTYAIALVQARLPSYSVKPSDQSTTSTTPVAADALSLALAANSTYFFRFDVIFRSSNASGSIKIEMVPPAGVVSSTFVIQIPSAVLGAMTYITSFDPAGEGAAIISTDTNYVATITGIISTGATPGSVAVKFGTTNSNFTCTIKAGSYGFANKLTA